jgi:hypothetical protein
MINDPQPVILLTPFSLNEEGVFNDKLEQLKGIVATKKDGNVPDLYYAEVIKELIVSHLTDKQEEAIYRVFSEKSLVHDVSEIKIGRRIYRYNPQNQNELDQIITGLQSKIIWERIEPKIQDLLPNHYELIVNKCNELHNQKNIPLNSAFQEMMKNLDIWNAPEGTENAIETLKTFQEKYKDYEFYKGLDWEVVYNLIMSKSNLISFQQMKVLLKIYLSPLSQVGIKKNQSLKFIVMNNVIVINNISNLCDRLKAGFENKGLKQDEEEHIAKLCSWLDLTADEEAQLFGLFPDKKLKEIFLVNRVKVYCKNWDLHVFETFFKFICSKFYYKEIERDTFLLCAEHSHTLLSEKQKIQIENMVTSEWIYLKWDYKCGAVKAGCNELKNLEVHNQDTQNQLEMIKKELRLLAEAYASPYRYLHWTYWRSLFFHIRSLQLSSELYKPILEIFKTQKEARYNIGRFTSTVSRTVSSYVYGEEDMPRMGPEWKGEKCDDTFINAVQSWIKVNTEWIGKKNKEAHDNSKGLIEKVNDLLNVAEYPVWKMKLQGIINDPEFRSAFHRLLTLGPEQSSGIVLIIKELCDFMFTKMNGVSFIVNLKKKLIPLGLEKLATSKREVSYLAVLESLKFMSPCQLPLELQHKAIEELSEDIKTPYFQLLGLQRGVDVNWDPHLNGNLPCPFLSLKYQGQEESVKLIRIASPMGPRGINPEFGVFLRNGSNNTTKKSLFISLQSSVDPLLKYNWKNVFFVAFPNMQEGASLYPTFVAFKQELTQKFIAFTKGTFNNGQVEINKEGNYKMPSSWLDSGKFKDALEMCMNDVKKIFFLYTEPLDASDRRIFIKLFNVRFALYLIKYTGATTFGFLGDSSDHRMEGYSALMLKILTILFEKKDTVACGDEADAFTYDEMSRSLVNGPSDDLVEVFDFLDKLDVQKRLIANKEIFQLDNISFPDFKLQSIEDD